MVTPKNTPNSVSRISDVSSRFSRFTTFLSFFWGRFLFLGGGFFFFGVLYISLHSPYIDLTYGRSFGFLKCLLILEMVQEDILPRFSWQLAKKWFISINIQKPFEAHRAPGFRTTEAAFASHRRFFFANKHVGVSGSEVLPTHVNSLA